MATEDKRVLLPEIAHRRGGQDVTRGYVDALPLLPNVDRVLAQAGGWRGYDELLRDDQVGAAFDQRRLAVISRPWRVDAGGDRRVDRQAADLVRKTLERIEWDRVTDAMLYARFYGYAVAEILWQADGSGIGIAAIAVRDRARFGFAPDNSLRLRTSSNPNGVEVPDRKFWAVAVGATHTDEPYGRGIAHRLYWPVYFKRQGARFWSVFLEKFGAPTVVGKFPQTEAPDSVQRLLDAAAAVQTDAAIAIPENMTVELLEAARGGAATYPEWMAYWNDAIAKVILGQTASTQGTPGRLGNDELQGDVLQNILRADADMVCHSASASWVRWLVDLNLPGAAYPSIWREMDDPDDLGVRADRDVKLHQIGLRLTPEAVKRVYGDDYELFEIPDPAPATRADAAPTTAASRMECGHGVRFAQPEPLPAPASDGVTAQIDRLSREADAALEPWVERIRALVDQADSLEDLRDRLVELLPDLPAAQFTQLMADALAAAHLAGRYDLMEGL